MVVVTVGLWVGEKNEEAMAQRRVVIRVRVVKVR